MSVLRQAGKVWMYMLLMSVFALMAAPALMLDSPWLRIPLNLALFAGAAALAYKDGGTLGCKEVAHDQTLARRREDGVTLGGEGLRSGYRPSRGLLAAALAASPFLIAALALATLAKPSEYVLQSLPTWLAAYLRRADIGGALRYYDETRGAGAVDFLRIAVRLAMMPASYIASGFGDQASLLLDRLSPLLVLLLPGAHAVGYLRGPAIQKLAAKRSEEAKRLHKKKVAQKKKRERQAREGKRPERLI